MLNRFESFTGSILELSRYVQKIKELEMKPLGLKAGHVMCLYNLGKSPQGLTVTELAEHAQISPSYLSGLFKAYTGQSIIDYTNRIKVERVKEMLISQRGILLREAGESVGILDENYLSRLFKRYAGMSVRDFQHLHRPDGLQIPQAQA